MTSFATINAKDLKSAIVRARDCIGSDRRPELRNLRISCNGAAVVEFHGAEYSGRVSMPCDHLGADFDFRCTIDSIDGFQAMIPRGSSRDQITLRDSGEIESRLLSQVLSPIVNLSNRNYSGRVVFGNDLHPNTCHVHPQAFAESAKRVAMAVDTDCQRYALGAVRISWEGDKLELIATDSRRLHREHIKCACDSEFGKGSGLIPSAALLAFIKTIGRVGMIKIETNGIDYRLTQEIGGTGPVIFGECQQGRFPRVEDVIPPAGKQFAIHPKTALALTKKYLWRHFTNENRGVSVYVDPQGKIRAHLGEDTIDIGQNCPVEFKAFYVDLRYLDDVFKACGNHTVHVSTLGDGSPIRFDCGEFMAIVMPISQDR